MSIRVLVTGGGGQLASAIRKVMGAYPQLALTFIDHDQLDLADEVAIAAFFAAHSFEVLINCAAYTAVDKAESEPVLAEQINARAVAVLAQLARERRMAFIQVSTDYVFDGCHYLPYRETDPVAPQGVYGRSKWQGEQALQYIGGATCIVRTSWLYSEFGGNFVKTMLRLGKERAELGVIYDQVGTPTYAPDLAAVLLQLASHPETLQGQLYHYSNEGVCSWYDLAKTIFELADIPCLVKPLETSQYPTPAKRPAYSVMNKARIKQALAISIPYWKDSLKICLKALNNDN